MKTKTKIGIGVASFIAVGLVLTLIFGETPGNDMLDLADEFCACETQSCRDGVATKITELEKEHVGKSARQEVVDQWNRAQTRIVQCAAKPPAR